LPELNVNLVPEERGVESLARQIKVTGRAYPLFDIAQMILQKPERHTVSFAIKKNQEGQPIQALFLCALDETLWLSEDEAVRHVLKRHFATFYQAERTATEPPKGKYTFVAQCGLSGVVLGPPNYHDYQNQLRKLHAERFGRMPFEAYKAQVKIVRDEEVVKKWVEDQSWKTDYLCLNLPEPLRLGTTEAVEQHFRETHKANIVKQVESYTLSGSAARSLRSPELIRLVRSVWEDQRRFPLQIATVLSQQFASHGLQFFKVNKTITHVSVARPHYLDPALTPVSDGVKRIVDYINANPRCTRRQLIETQAPSPTILPVSAPGEGQAATPQESPAPTPEQNALIGDLHWLIHQGHVIEFANGTLETAKKPVPKPPKPAAKKEEKTAAAAGESVSSETVSAATSEATPGSTPSEVPASEGETNSNHVLASEVAPTTVAEESSIAAPVAEAPVTEIESTEQPETEVEKQSTPPLDQGSNPSPAVVSATSPSPVESPS
jgi:hypothetical protein